MVPSDDDGVAVGDGDYVRPRRCTAGSDARAPSLRSATPGPAAIGGGGRLRRRRRVVDQQEGHGEHITSESTYVAVTAEQSAIRCATDR